MQRINAESMGVGMLGQFIATSDHTIVQIACLATLGNLIAKKQCKRCANAGYLCLYLVRYPLQIGNCLAYVAGHTYMIAT
jgi:hypothetical protein